MLEMLKFSADCTLKQAKLASKLGAPIEHDLDASGNQLDELLPPTIQEMVGWLRTKDYYFQVHDGKHVTTIEIQVPTPEGYNTLGVIRSVSQHDFENTYNEAMRQAIDFTLNRMREKHNIEIIQALAIPRSKEAIEKAEQRKKERSNN